MFSARFLFLAAGVAALAASCKKPDINDYEIPTTYNFANVNYSGQTARLSMLTELSTLVKSANTPNAAALDATVLKNMYRNENAPFAEAGLNTSGKQLRDKTAPAVQDAMEDLLDAVATASASTSVTTPSNGTAGVVSNNAGDKTYLLNANGVELAQIIEKGIMGACFYYQATAVYLGEGKMNVDNETVTEGEGTAMEHHWDEAFGYFGVPIDFPVNTNGLLYWGKYSNARNTLLATNGDLMNAFLKGRAAISNKDIDTRDLAIADVRRVWELVCVSTAISYLNVAKANVGVDAGVYHHAASEAYAFVWSLKFGGAPRVTSAQVDALLVLLADSADPLNANLYPTTANDIQGVIDALVGYYPAVANVKDQL